MDWNGLSAFVAASAAGLVSVGTLTMQVLSWTDQRRAKKAQDELLRASERRDVTLGQVKSLVNGQTEELKARVAKEAYDAGRRHERETPNDPTPDVISVPAPMLAPKEDAL